MDTGTVTVTVRMNPALKRRLLKAAPKDTLNAVMIEAAERWLEEQLRIGKAVTA